MALGNYSVAVYWLTPSSPSCDGPDELKIWMRLCFIYWYTAA